MMRLVLSLTVVIYFVVGLAAGGTDEFSLSGKPKWYRLSSAEPCVVRDLVTHNQVGSLPPGEKILVFGITEKYATFSYFGRLAYVPAACVEEEYKVAKAEPVWRGWGPTLEELVEKSRKELVETAKEKERLLNPSLKQPAAGEQGAGGTAAGGAPLPGVQGFVRENMTLEGGRGRGYY